MKRKIFSLFIVVQLAMGIMLTGCSGEKKNVAESKESVSQEKDEYFVWFLDGKGLGGLTDEGKKQEKLVIPSNCEKLMGSIVTRDSDVKEISFEGTVDSDFDSGSLVSSGTKIEKVEYPEGMTKLISSSLSREENLISVVLPSSLTEISAYCINNCNSLENINLEDTNVSTIGEYAFQHCDSLKEVRLPSSIKEIGEFAFPSSIEDVYIPKDAELSKYNYNNFPNTDGTVNIHLYKDSWTDKNFDDWFNGSPNIVRVYED